MDVFGPLEENSRGRPRYLATFLDDFSKLSSVVPIIHTSQGVSVVKEVGQMLETQTGNKLQGVRTDKGSESLNAQLEGFLQRERGQARDNSSLHT